MKSMFSQLETLRALVNKGLSLVEIGKELNLDRKKVHYRVKKYGLKSDWLEAKARRAKQSEYREARRALDKPKRGPIVKRLLKELFLLGYVVKYGNTIDSCTVDGLNIAVYVLRKKFHIAGSRRYYRVVCQKPRRLRIVVFPNGKYIIEPPTNKQKTYLYYSIEPGETILIEKDILKKYVKQINSSKQAVHSASRRRAARALSGGISES